MRRLLSRRALRNLLWLVLISTLLLGTKIRGIRFPQDWAVLPL